MTLTPIASTPAPFKYVAKAHPTVYAGITFRSRLEATWAAFFDQIKVKWQYEPIDLHGWVPDFILENTVAVEVKPIRKSLDEMPFEVAKMRASGWPGSMIVLGNEPRCYRREEDIFGWLLSGTGHVSGDQIHPPHSGHFAFYGFEPDLSYSWETDGGGGCLRELMDEAWATAFRTTQWKAPKVRRK